MENVANYINYYLYYMNAPLLKYLLLSLLLITTDLRAQIITTIAGTGIAGYTGDGGLAIDAQLKYPTATAFDVFGNLYIADFAHGVRMINTAGVITTIVHFNVSASFGDYGDGGAASAASISTPSAIAIAPNGNIYITDANRHNVRMINGAGIISTVAGDRYGSFGVAGHGIPAASSALDEPYGLAVDTSGNIYIADYSGVHKINSAGIITKFAGGGPSTLEVYDGLPATSSNFGHSFGLATDNHGNVYITSTYMNQVFKVSSTGLIFTYAGTTQGYSGDGGQATNAELKSPGGITVDRSGNVYIADRGNHCIRKINSSGVITTVAGKGIQGYFGDGGHAINAMCSWPQSVTADTNFNLYISDYGNYRIRKVTAFCESPVVAPITGGNLVMSGDTIMLSNSTAGGTWYSRDTAIAKVSSTGVVTGNTVAGSLSTEICYTVTDTCTTSFSSHKVRVNNPLGTSGPFLNNEISIYPNPVTTTLNIFAIEKINKVVISNIFGQTLYEQQYNGPYSQINVADFPSGIYLIRINGSEIRKFEKR